MITKKEFEGIAEVISRAKERGYGTWRTSPLVSELADYFETANPNFDRNKFFKDCKVI